MCDNVIGWAQDPEVSGDHSSTPVKCSEYIAQLEAALSSADSKLLDDLRKSCGIKVVGAGA